MQAKTQPKQQLWILALVFGVLLFIDAVIVNSTLMPGMAWDWVCTFGLMSFFLAYLSIIGNLYIRELTKMIGISFVDTHHILTYTAFAMMAAHPIALILGGETLAVLLPKTSSLSEFLGTSGPIAIYVFVVAAIVAVLRKKIKTGWRFAHWLVYAGFVVATIHSGLVGTNFKLTGYRVVISLLALSVVYAFARKRVMMRRPTRRPMPTGTQVPTSN